MEQFLLETIPNQVKDRKLIWNNQYGYANKWCLNNLVVFSDEVIGLASEKKAVGIVDFALSRACDTVSHCIAGAQRVGDELDKWIRM